MPKLVELLVGAGPRSFQDGCNVMMVASKTALHVKMML
jgi:hypothetical protein